MLQTFQKKISFGICQQSSECFGTKEMPSIG